jgi:hypothetical protein
MFSLLLIVWVRADRRLHGLNVPFEFDVFVFFAWPIFVPYYLFRTRGWTGLIFGIGIWWLFLAPVVVAAFVGAFTMR